MALTSSVPAFTVAVLKGGVHEDSAPTATAVRDVFTEGVYLRSVFINNVAPAAAVWIQLFNKQNPAVGTDKADAGFPAVSDAYALIEFFGDTGQKFANGVSYALSDAPSGGTMTAGTRRVKLGSEPI